MRGRASSFVPPRVARRAWRPQLMRDSLGGSHTPTFRAFFLFCVSRRASTRFAICPRGRVRRVAPRRHPGGLRGGAPRWCNEDVGAAGRSGAEDEHVYRGPATPQLRAARRASIEEKLAP